MAAEELEPRVTPAAVLPSGFQETLVASGLTLPSAQVFAPDGRLFVAQTDGAVKIVQDGRVLPTNFLTLGVDTYGERGLSGIELDPDFAHNGYVYVYYTKADPTNPNVAGNGAVNRLSRFTASAGNPNVADPSSELVLLDNIASTTGYHNGGALHFGPDGELFLGVGESNVATNAQDLSNLNGKILRILPGNYPNIIPPDNPFAGQPGRRGEIWAYGFRNPFSAAIKPGTSTVFINDVGANAWEEVDDLVRGGELRLAERRGEQL